VKAGVTWLVVGAVAVVGLAAAVDALRGTPELVPPSTTQSGTDLSAASNASGLHGVLYYTGEDCVLHSVRLPELQQEQVPLWRSCEFSLSPDRRQVAAAGTAWDRRGVVSAVERQGGVTVSFTSGESIAIEGTAPAFTRFGNLSLARDGAIHVGDPVCLLNEQGDFEPCSRVAVRKRVLRRALLRHPTVPDDPALLRDLMVDEAVWLDADRLVLLLVADVRFVGRFRAIALVEDPLTVDLVDSGLGTDFSILGASPRGRYFAVSTSNRPELRIFDREGDTLTLPPLTDPHAIAWSPGDTWTAVATRASVHVFNAGRPGSRVQRLPIAAADLAWR
jgi:hypothetical protein